MSINTSCAVSSSRGSSMLKRPINSSLQNPGIGMHRAPLVVIHVFVGVHLDENGADFSPYPLPLRSLLSVLWRQFRPLLRSVVYSRSSALEDYQFLVIIPLVMPSQSGVQSSTALFARLGRRAGNEFARGRCDNIMKPYSAACINRHMLTEAVELSRQTRLVGMHCVGMAKHAINSRKSGLALCQHQRS